MVTRAAPSLDDALAGWLATVAETRNLATPPPLQTPQAGALRALLGVFSAEFADYRTIAAGARDAARRNAAQLSAVAASTEELRALITEAALAITETSRSAVHVADAANGLRRFAVDAATAADGAAEGLTEIQAALDLLGTRLAEGREPVGRMERSTAGVAGFLNSLGRLSRQAQLLSINAAIEAAHLADEGARFALVASEVRKLSTSTRDASADVARITAELRESTARVAHAIDDAERQTQGADGEIVVATGTLANTQRSIGDFEETTLGIAAIAGQQRTALEHVSEAITSIVNHAAETVRASAEAGHLDLEQMLAAVEHASERWQLIENPPPFTIVDDAFCVWVMEIGMGASMSLSDDFEEKHLAAAVLDLVQRVDAEQTEILRGVTAIAVAVARNGFGWRTIAQSLAALHAELESVRSAVDQSAHGARTAADLAGRMRNLVASMQRQYDDALASLETALGRITAIANGVSDIDALVGAMTGAAERAGEIMHVIDTISSETDLLSLNAAIEAAHAGELGRGFGVIAEEIRSLALTTHQSTQHVADLVEDVVAISDAIRTSVAASHSGTTEVTASAERVRSAIASMRGSFESTMNRALDVSSTAEEQSRALDRVQANIERSVAAVDSQAARATNERRLELATLGSNGHAVAARRSVSRGTARLHAYAVGLADRVETIVDEAISARRMALDDLTAGRYTELSGSLIGSLARLFDVRAVPPSGFTPPKFQTSWDAAIDEPLIALLDTGMDEAAFCRPVTIAVCDLNGFVVAHPRRLIADWTGDPARDMRANRVKRLLDDEYSLRVCRWGLGHGVERIGPRAPYAAFRDAGCDLARSHAERPWGVYVYARDVEDIFNEISIGLFAHGWRFGALRLVYEIADL